MQTESSYFFILLVTLFYHLITLIIIWTFFAASFCVDFFWGMFLPHCLLAEELVWIYSPLFNWRIIDLCNTGIGQYILSIFISFTILDQYIIAFIIQLLFMAISC